MKALITGITGQDGSYLAELLLDKGYEVHGIVRRVAMEDTSLRFSRIKHLLGRITLHPGLVDDYASVYSIISRVMPDEIYHLAAQSFVAESFKDPFSVMKINVLGTLNVLEAVRNLVPKCRMYNAASSEMYGKVYETPQKETDSNLTP
jgi:GDPmannose 4,6-dehydratase